MRFFDPHMSAILFVDSQNFFKKIEEVMVSQAGEKPRFDNYNFAGLFDSALQGIKLDRKIFYSGKLSIDHDNVKKSKELIERQRLIKLHLEKSGFEFLISGRVRAHIEMDSRGRPVKTFKEKGVDVAMAVDMVSFACDKKITSAVIGSSDSDLQPAIRELRKRGIERIYLGFEMNPNKGMTYTTDRTILIRNAEVLRFVTQTLV
ncbi:MAG: NYN domain-containing protein [Patescibacteria group bacterium]